jgi:hypothetical protein
MKKITVYADFDFLSDAQEIGILGYEHVRGKDHFVFEYSREWLKQYGGILLSGDLMNVPSLQHPRGNDNVFGFVKDSFPDRWGRLLLDRRERLTAQKEGRPTTISAITVSCLLRKAGHSHLHTTSILEQSHTNACSLMHIQKSRTSMPYSLQARTICLKDKKQQRL